jgi:accessory secretory protein Asp3
MTGEKWTIYWNEYSANAYLYGSEIFYHKKDDVEYINALMPPGTVIKEWYSRTNYQARRIEPALPLIDGEGSYRMTVSLDCPEGEAWLMRLVFYDRYDMEAGSIPVRDNVTEFRCPLKTYSYKLQLINGGMTRFHFHSVVIQEIVNETGKEFETTE